jgi:Domain of unknown function (DUF3560)
MNEYEEKQQARRERYEERADKAEREARERFGRAQGIGSMIPFDQPILVGHHSEGRHRRDLDRIDRNMRAGVDLSKKAEYYRNKADGVGKGGYLVGRSRSAG